MTDETLELRATITGLPKEQIVPVGKSPDTWPRPTTFFANHAAKSGSVRTE
eukprot:SAG31_NODE_1993_length_6709_cov_5.744024_7_plen_51_part_00